MRNKVVVHLYGGIGNQLFQYSFGEYLRNKFNLDVYYDISTFDILGPNRELQINIIAPNLPIFKTNKYFFSRHTKIFKRISQLLFKLKSGNYYFLDKFNEDFIKKNNWRVLYFDGYWQNKKYVEWISKHIDNFYNPKIEEPEEITRYIKWISAHNVTSIHIRRGDYLNPENINYIGTCSLNYYKSAAEYILNKDETTEFLVFSDDTSWVKENLKLPKDFIVVEDSDIKPIWYIKLMSCCKNNILSNSTFSWWGSFLNRNANNITVAPKHWMKSTRNPNLYFENWHLIDNWD